MSAKVSAALQRAAHAAIEAAQKSYGEPLDALVVTCEGPRGECAGACTLQASPVTTAGDMYRRSLELHCSALSQIVEQATHPEELIAEIANTLRQTQGLPRR